MPRQFGLKATPAAARSASAGSSKDLPDRFAPVLPAKARTRDSSQVSKLFSPDGGLLYAPASWRGCRGRRSISPG
jgi:hypothetical protein